MEKIHIRSDVTGSVIAINVAIGNAIKAGDEILTIESMKMEIPIVAARGGIVVDVLVAESASIEEGQTVVVIEV